MTTKFDRNDDDYQDWLKSHPNGYVINARRRLVPSYMVLHRVSCRSVRSYSLFAPHGAYTERGYVKICAEKVSDLRAWVRKNGRPDGTFSKECSLCNWALSSCLGNFLVFRKPRPPSGLAPKGVGADIGYGMMAYQLDLEAGKRLDTNNFSVARWVWRRVKMWASNLFSTQRSLS